MKTEIYYKEDDLERFLEPLEWLLDVMKDTNKYKAEYKLLKEMNDKFTKILQKQGYKIKHIHPINNQRYTIITGRENSPNIMILYKSRWFEKFGEKFERYGEKRGEGDSINVEDLETAEKYNVERLYMVRRCHFLPY